MREQLGDGVHRTPTRERETARCKRQIHRRQRPLRVVPGIAARHHDRTAAPASFRVHRQGAFR